MFYLWHGFRHAVQRHALDGVGIHDIHHAYDVLVCELNPVLSKLTIDNDLTLQCVQLLGIRAIWCIQGQPLLCARLMLCAMIMEYE